MSFTVNNTADQLREHIIEKMSYHQKLLLKYEAEEKYEECIYHRDEIARLRNMLSSD